VQNITMLRGLAFEEMMISRQELIVKVDEPAPEESTEENVKDAENADEEKTEEDKESG
jgi:hypothetical protein